MELLNIKGRSSDYIVSYTFVFLLVKSIKSNNFFLKPLDVIDEKVIKTS